MRVSEISAFISLLCSNGKYQIFKSKERYTKIINIIGIYSNNKETPEKLKEMLISKCIRNVIDVYTMPIISDPSLAGLLAVHGGSLHSFLYLLILLISLHF